MQRAIPRRSRVLVPSSTSEPWRTVQSMPFSACKLPVGTTRLELVTSGRSVTMGSLLVGHPSAFAREQVEPLAIARSNQISSQLGYKDDCLSIPDLLPAGEPSRADLGQTHLVRRSRSPRMRTGDRARRLVCRSPLRRFLLRRELLPLRRRRYQRATRQVNQFCDGDNELSLKALRPRLRN